MIKSVSIGFGVVAIILQPSFAVAQNALPSNPTIVAGSIGISNPSDSSLLVEQSDAAGIINWGGFSVGSGNTVRFSNGTGATLNRVTGAELSTIYGSIDATGSIYLINENGILFGETGVVRTGGDFIASTNAITDADFLNGGDAVFSGDQDTYVVNLGSVASMGGNVALIARNVVNEGEISALNGTAALVAGREILMRDTALDNGLFVVRVGGDDTAVTDKGRIEAASVELRANGGNIYAMAGNTEGSIKASGVAKTDGRVFLTAGAGGSVAVSKQISATKADGSGGDIRVTGENINVSGVLDASSLVGQGGNVILWANAEAVFTGQINAFGDGTTGSGGFAEVSGKRRLTFDGLVDTGGGTLLIDPSNIEITYGSGTLVGASLLNPGVVASNLAANNVVIQTSGIEAEAGTILVLDGFSYNSIYDLTLLAHGDIDIRASILNDNALSGDVNLVAGWDGTTGWDGGTVFSPGVYDALDLTTQTAFGTASGASYVIGAEPTYSSSGSIFIGSASSFYTVAVGALAGATRAYANDLVFTGSATTPLYDPIGAQLGYFMNFSVFSPVTGEISARAKNDIYLNGGNQLGSYAQIGHVGAVFLSEGLPDGDVNAPITVEAGRNISLIAGSGSDAYAQIGHGSATFSTGLYQSGNRQGSIDLTALGEITVQDNIGKSWIGHTTLSDPLYPGTVFNADIFAQAAAFDQSSSSSVAAGALGAFSSELIQSGLMGGSVTISATNSGLQLGSLTIDIATSTDLLIEAQNDIVLPTGFSFNNGGTGNLVFAAGAKFQNNAGSGAFSTGSGQWLVYSTRPDSNLGDIGILPYDFIQYGVAFDSADPIPTTLPTGNGLIYSVSPVVTVGDVQTTYGTIFADPAVVTTVSGASVVAADFGITTGPVILDIAGVTYAPSGFIAAGAYTGVLSSAVTPQTVFGVTSVAGDLTVDPATLSVVLADQTKIYDGGAYTGAITYSGFVGSGVDSAALITTGPTFTYLSSGNGGDTSGTNAGSYTVLASGTVINSTNYALDETDTAQLVIDPATVSVLLADQTKIYDGAAFSGAVTYSGFIGSDSAALITSGPVFTYSGADTTGTNIGTYTVAGSGAVVSSANYVLDQTDTAQLTNTSASSYPAPPPSGSEPGIPSEITPVMAPKTNAVLIGTNSNSLLSVSSANTDAIIEELAAGSRFCSEIAQKEYVIDCMSDRLDKAAKNLPSKGDYSDVKTALEVASRKLNDLALQNASAAMTRSLVLATGPGGGASSRPLVPVESSLLDQLNAQAGDILGEAQTILLRSTENSERRKVHYERIAEAVGSNKVLLRSL